MADAHVKALDAYQKDSRIACQYGARCYQKNPLHHQRYKHPPTQIKPAGKGKKRKIATKNALPKAKMQKNDESGVADKHRLSPTPSLSSDDEDTTKISDSSSDNDESIKSNDKDEKIFESPETTILDSKISPDVNEKSCESLKSHRDSKDNDEKPSTSEKTEKKNDDFEDMKNLIKTLFLLEMPEDFYKFYEFCVNLSQKSPELAFKIVGLNLVGPYDVLLGKIDGKTTADDKFLRHWRYFYDPPEFQTILKVNNKDGLHFGYWRDEDDKLPVFVAKNSANKDCKIIPVAENIFGAVFTYVEEKSKIASPFEKPNIQRLLKKLKIYCEENNINLEKETINMKSRNRKSVTKTFHGAGIVVPYDKKTQIGYRTLAATDSQFKIILKNLEESDDNTRIEYRSKIEEMVRLATIAADECDFGTSLELAHDLFSSGIESVEKIAEQMFTMSYDLLRRPIFRKIAQTHLKNRRKDCNLSVF